MINANQRLSDFLCRFVLQPPATCISTERPDAAVLVPVINGPHPRLLLTLRASRLRYHAGEVAFPGGMRDDNDASLIDTALRETEEETGIPRSQITIIGKLPTVRSRRGILVRPVLGIVAPDIVRRPNVDEVDTLFEVPLQTALHTAHYLPLPLLRNGISHTTWFFWYQRFFIWGLTATILHQLSLQIAGNKPSCK